MNEVEIKFTEEGVSATAYNEDGSIHDESWYTWSEVENLKELDGADVIIKDE